MISTRNSLSAVEKSEKQTKWKMRMRSKPGVSTLKISAPCKYFRSSIQKLGAVRGLGGLSVVK